MKISKTLITEEEIENKISEIADEINEKYKGEELVVIGILKGAFIAVSYTHLTLPTILLV